MGPFAACSPVTGWFSRVYATEAEAQIEADRHLIEHPSSAPVVVVERNGNAAQLVRGVPEYLGGPALPLQLRVVAVPGGRGAVVRWRPSC